jgi:hypothetical protein
MHLLPIIIIVASVLVRVGWRLVRTRRELPLQRGTE